MRASSLAAFCSSVSSILRGLRGGGGEPEALEGESEARPSAGLVASPPSVAAAGAAAPSSAGFSSAGFSSAGFSSAGLGFGLAGLGLGAGFGAASAFGARGGRLRGWLYSLHVARI